MQLTSLLIVSFIAILHIYIMIIEMYFWDKPRGLKAFGLKHDFATSTKVLGANQGLYNGFLAAGLIWGLIHQQEAFGFQIQLFFLSCIFVAGIYGAVTFARKIIYIQSVPSLIAIILVYINYSSIN